MRFALFALLVALAPTARAEEPRLFRILSGTPNGIGLAWGFRGHRVDFEKLRKSTRPLDFTKHPLVNYLVDMASDRVLAVVNPAGGEFGDVLMSDIHPGVTVANYYGLKEFRYAGDPLRKRDGSDVDAALELKLNGTGDLHTSADGVLTNAYVVTLPTAGDAEEKRLVARCDDCSEQFEALLAQRLPPGVYDRYHREFTQHSFTYEQKENGDLKFALTATGCWWNGGELTATGELAVTAEGDHVKLAMPADVTVTQLDPQACLSPHP